MLINKDAISFDQSMILVASNAVQDIVRLVIKLPYKFIVVRWSHLNRPVEILRQ
jgi:hypothetical protein